jgi:hypothetical protein
MSSRELVEEFETTGFELDGRELSFDLRSLDGRESSRVCFFSHSPSSRVQISIDSERYPAEIDQTVCVTPSGASAKFGVTVLTGRILDRPAGGSVLIAVNCGQEPPTLQIAARLPAGSVRSWSWAISHDIQHRILELFARTT